MFKEVETLHSFLAAIWDIFIFVKLIAVIFVVMAAMNILWEADVQPVEAGQPQRTLGERIVLCFTDFLATPNVFAATPHTPFLTAKGWKAVARVVVNGLQRVSE